jgi:proteasome lid subunit RPN8/RPN11
LEVQCISAFITPGGQGLVLLIEDSHREVRLDWLEMLHYRAVLHTPIALGTFAEANQSRYGDGCRDLSAVLSQDDVALWASTASRSLKSEVRSENASLLLWRRDDKSGAVESVAIVPPRYWRTKMGDWTVVDDARIREKLSAYRQSKLPNETGGVIIGHFDVQYSTCYIVDALPSPGDSVEWPTAYYRGVEGLRTAVVDIETITLGQLTYVGEWHSHPEGCPALPSAADLTAYGWLRDYMNSDSYPAIMVIIGERDDIGIVAAEPTELEL